MNLHLCGFRKLLKRLVIDFFFVEMDSRPPLSRTPSFNAATRQRKTSTSSSTESSHSVSRVNLCQPSVGRSVDGELSNHVDHLTFDSTPEFSSSSQINEMLYRYKSNSSLPPYRPTYERLDSSNSVSSSSSAVTDRDRPPPPSYSESHFSRRESSVTSLTRDARRGSGPGLYYDQGGHVDNRHHDQNCESYAHNNKATSATTKVRYIGGLSSPTQSDSDYNGDDVHNTYNPPPSVMTSNYDDKVTSSWLRASARSRSNIAVAHYNLSKVGIMSNSESTGYYYVKDMVLNRANIAVSSDISDKAHLSTSTSAIYQQEPVSGAIPRSHYSGYSPDKSLRLQRNPPVGRFFHDRRGEWVDEDEMCITLV